MCGHSRVCACVRARVRACVRVRVCERARESAVSLGQAVAAWACHKRSHRRLSLARAREEAIERERERESDTARAGGGGVGVPPAEPAPHRRHRVRPRCGHPPLLREKRGRGRGGGLRQVTRVRACAHVRWCVRGRGAVVRDAEESPLGGPSGAGGLSWRGREMRERGGVGVEREREREVGREERVGRAGGEEGGERERDCPSLSQPSARPSTSSWAYAPVARSNPPPLSLSLSPSLPSLLPLSNLFSLSRSLPLSLSLLFSPSPSPSPSLPLPPLLPLSLLLSPSLPLSSLP